MQVVWGRTSCLLINSYQYYDHKTLIHTNQNMLLYALNKGGLNSSRLTSLKFVCVGNPNHNEFSVDARCSTFLLLVTQMGVNVRNISKVRGEGNEFIIQCAERSVACTQVPSVFSVCTSLFFVTI